MMEDLSMLGQVGAQVLRFLCFLILFLGSCELKNMTVGKGN